MAEESSPVPMDIPVRIRWARRRKDGSEEGEGAKSPIDKAFPFSFSSFTFSNPSKKRKIKTALAEPSALKSLEDKIARSHAVGRREDRRAARLKEAAPLSQKLFSLNCLISSYLSLLLNAFLVGLLVVLVLKFVFTVKNDIATKSLKRMAEARMDIEDCRRKYLINRCGPGDRVPAMEEKCVEWERCMSRDPLRAEVTAAVFRVASESLEELFGGISVRSVLIGFLFVFLLFKLR